MKIGDKVIYTSGVYITTKYNPLHSVYPNVTGTITKFLGEPAKRYVRVKWSIGTQNVYSFSDLELVSDYQSKIAKHFNV